MTAVTRLSLADFRNHRDAVIEAGAGFVLLSGPNGAGKTNVMEAVSLLTPGRGLRQVPISEMARSDGPGGFSVAATLLPLPQAGGDRGEGLLAYPPEDSPSPSPSREREGGIALGTGTSPTAPDRRQVRINGAPASVNSLSEWLSVLWLTPAMDRLFTDSAGGRRRFVDRLTLALEPTHAHHAARYEAAMRSRNKLLAEERWDEAWLDSLETQMGEHGREVTMARIRTLKALSKAVWGVSGDDFPKGRLYLENTTTMNLQARLRASRKVHAAARRATHGPNNEDLLIHFGDTDRPAAQCSTGEQKALLLGLVLAHAELVAERRGAPPILLLDEVAAHLDPHRRAALFARLEGRGQVWMTATEPSLFEAIGGQASRFHVEAGTIFPA